MAFNYTKGEQIIGDLKGRDDSDKNTKIDFEEDEIKLVTGGTERVSISNSGIHVTGTADFQNPNGTEVIRISKSDDDFREIVFWPFVSLYPYNLKFRKDHRILRAEQIKFVQKIVLSFMKN